MVSRNGKSRVFVVLLGALAVVAGLVSVPVSAAAPEPAEPSAPPANPPSAVAPKDFITPGFKPLFTKEVAKPKNSKADERVTKAKRVRYVEIDAQEYIDKLIALPNNIFEGGPPSDKVMGPPPGGPSLEMQLFDGVVETIPAREVRVSLDGSVAWFGRLERKGQNPIYVVLSFHAAKENQPASMSGSIYKPGVYSYEVISGTNNSVTMVEKDLNAATLQAEGPNPKALTAPVGSESSLTETNANSTQASVSASAPVSAAGVIGASVSIKVLVVYTPAAANAVPNIGSVIQAQIDRLNQIFANSQMGQRVVLAGTAQTPYTSSGDMDIDLDRLTGKSEGFMDEVHALRLSRNADLVQLWLDGPKDACGLAWRTGAGGSSAHGFGVTSPPAIGGCPPDVVSHELGHNLGGNHNRENANLDNLPFSYSYDYRRVAASNGFTTTLAYHCGTLSQCPFIPHFSNPNVSYNGYATGVSETAANAANNALSMTNMAGIISNYVGDATPFGQIDVISMRPGGMQVEGWAIDADRGTGPIDVHLYIDGAHVATTTANLNRPDVGSAYPAYGSNHGFSAFVAAAPGTRQVCAYGINFGVGNNSLLGCKNFDVPFEPIGSFDVAEGHPGAIVVKGWALDPETANPIAVHTYVNGSYYASTTANVARQDVANNYPGYGANHGFDVAYAVYPGNLNVCTYAINVGAGTNQALGCKTVSVPSGSPIGFMDFGYQVPGGIGVEGWALDPDTASPISVHIYANNSHVLSLTANLNRSDIGSIYPAYGPNHGYGGSFPAAPGNYNVCAYGINVGVGSNTLLSCKTVTVANYGNPIGAFDKLSRVSGGLRTEGWAIDLETTAPLSIHVYMDGAHVATTTANVYRGDIFNAYRGYGGNHGFDVSFGADGNPHTVCVYAINQGVGNNALLGCATG